jgi:hypothetical protein
MAAFTAAFVGLRPRADGSVPTQRQLSTIQYAPSFVFLAVVIADCGRYADTDLWGHIYFGGLLLHLGPYLGADSFSYLPHHTAWLHHEWLSEALMAWLYGFGGILLLKVWKFACSAFILLMLSDAQDQSDIDPRLRCGLLLIASFALIPYMQFRPMVMAFGLSSALFALLTRDNYRRTPLLLLVIPMMVFWANLHGSFFVGLAMLGVYGVIRFVLDSFKGIDLISSVRPVTLTVLASGATLMTPYGFNTWRAVIISLRNPMTRRIMSDWRPFFVVLAEQWRQPHGGAIFLIVGVIIVAAFIVSWLLAPKIEGTPLDAVAVMMAIGAAVSVRNTPLAIITATPSLTRHLGSFILRHQRNADRRDIDSRLFRLNGFTQGAVLAIAILFACQSGLFSRILPTATQYPDGAVAYMRKHQLSGNVLNAFAWGQYLIWHISPASKIFIDGRFDLVYSPEQVRDYLNFYTASPGLDRTLSKYPNDYILIPPSAPAVKLLKSRNDWRLIYSDNHALLFARPALAKGLNEISIAETAPSVFP